MSSSILRPAIISFLDQCSLSLVQFASAGALIYYSTSEEYGLFSFLMGITAFFTSLQNAVINTPLMVLLPRLSGRPRKNLTNGMTGIFFTGLFISFVCTLIIGTCLYIWKEPSEFRHITTLSFAFFTMSLLGRDFSRTNEYAALRPLSALRKDSCYACIALVLTGAAILSNSVNILTIMWCLILAVAAVNCFGLFTSSYKPSKDNIIFSAKKSWKYSKWSIIGVISSWLQNSAYLYLPFILLGTRAIAYLAAARLVMTPIILVAQSWGNYFRPLASSLFASNNYKSGFKILLKSIVLMEMLLILYTSAIITLLSIFPRNKIPEDYQHLDFYILFWTLIIGITILKNNLSFFLQAALNFKNLAINGFIAAMVTIAASILFIHLYGNHGVLYGQFTGELFFASLLLYYTVKKRHSLYKTPTDNCS